MSEEKKRVQSSGVTIGRAIEKLDQLNRDEAAEIAQRPDDIKARFAKRREKVLEPLDAAQRAKVMAAITAEPAEAPPVAPEAAPEED